MADAALVVSNAPVRMRAAGAPTTGSVGTDALADGAVTTPKIADGAVTSAKLAGGSVGLAKLDGYVLVTAADIAAMF